MTTVLQDEAQTNGRIRVDPRLLISVVGWLVSILLAWGYMGARVAVVESKQGDSDRRIERIEQKIDILIDRRP